MAIETQVSIEVWAIIIAAFLGAFIAQFLSFYRDIRREFEELKATLFLIAQLSEQDIESKARNRDSVLWYLKEELYRGFKSNVLFLGDAHDDILSVVRLYPGPDIDDSGSFEDASRLRQAARSAYESLDEIRPHLMIWQVVLGFLGVSREKYKDSLDQFLSPNEVEIDDVEIKGVKPGAEGYWLSIHRHTLWESGWIVLVLLGAAIVAFIPVSPANPDEIELIVLTTFLSFSAGAFLMILSHRLLSHKANNAISTHTNQDAE